LGGLRCGLGLSSLCGLHLGRLGGLRCSRGNYLLGFYRGKRVGYGFLVPANGQELLRYLIVIPLVLAGFENERY
jgi:hypothetical protein